MKNFVSREILFGNLAEFIVTVRKGLLYGAITYFAFKLLG